MLILAGMLSLYCMGMLPVLIADNPIVAFYHHRARQQDPIEGCAVLIHPILDEP